MVQRPNVVVFQEYTDLTTIPQTPDLDVLLVGPCYQILDYEDDKDDIYAGDYGSLDSACPLVSPSEMVLSAPPSLAPGAELVASSVKILFDSARAVIVENATGVTEELAQYNAGDNLFAPHTTVAGVDMRTAGVRAGDKLLTNGSGTTDYNMTVKEVIPVLVDFTGSPLNFVTSGVKPGDTVVLSSDGVSPSRNGRFTVLRVRTQNVAGSPVTNVLELQANTWVQNTQTDVGASTTNISVIAPDGTVRCSATGAFLANYSEIRTTADFETAGAPGDAYDWRIERSVSDIELSSANYSINGNEITLNAGITVDIETGVTGKKISFSGVYVQYLAIRQDLQRVLEFETTAQILDTLGKFDARNPLCVATIVAKSNTTTTVKAFGTYATTLLAYQDFLDKISAERKIYAIVPLTQDTSTLAMIMNSCETLADPNYALSEGIRQKFRVCIGSIPLTTQAYIVNVTGGCTLKQKTGTAPSPAVNRTMTLSGTTAGIDFVAAGIIPGDKIDADGTLYTITHVNGSLSVEVSAAFVTQNLVATDIFKVTNSAGTTDKIGPITLAGGLALTASNLDDLYLVLECPTASFISDGVIPGDYLQLPSSVSVNDWTTYNSWVVADVLSETRLEIVNAGSDTVTAANELPHNYSRTDTSAIVDGTIYQRVMRNYTKNQQVDAMVAVASSFASKRQLLCYPNRVDVTDLVDGSKARGSDGSLAAADPQPGYYLSCAVGGQTAGKPSQQGFTNMGISGISRVYDSSDYFTEEQLSDLSNGGVYVFIQDVAASLPYTIHEVTTDTSSLEFSEYMVIKNFDYIAWTFMDVLMGYLGRWNTIPETVEFVRDSCKSTGDTLKSRYVSRIGAPLTSYSIANVGLSTLASDRIECYINVDMPMTLNTIGIHLVA